MILLMDMNECFICEVLMKCVGDMSNRADLVTSLHDIP